MGCLIWFEQAARGCCIASIAGYAGGGVGGIRLMAYAVWCWWGGIGACGQAYALRWSGRRCATTALRCSVSWPVAELTALTSFAPFKQAATSQLTKRAARAATSPALLGAPEAHSSLPARAFAGTSLLVRQKAVTVPERQAAPGGRRFLWRRGAQVRGRRAQRASSSDLPQLFECSERSERSEFCGTTSGRAPQCSRSAAETATACALRSEEHTSELQSL